ncbi:MAG TPA: 3-hydroxyacyl-CoA dehydrogenase NAD-binding domain-containing protein [Gemmatimonadaceae bacterium]|nr:3-hydroxyacyl-CoA dehydrogenase NAD-binding domain-containing protein [Gemmatimonadaceae bacterium]
MTGVVELGARSVVGVLGAGAMGTGIAQVALAHGHAVVLGDAVAEALPRARAQLEKGLRRDEEKGRLPAGGAEAALARLTLADAAGEATLAAYAPCAIVVEAVVERLEVKLAAFRALEAVVGQACVLATNTSSLSVASIGAACARPERVLGAHFFNPAPVLPLVELVPGIATEPEVLELVRALVTAWGKVPVVAADTPGFIVNRIARPFYGESLRILEERIADVATIDWALRELGGFRMGPFELMDFIGNDVNYAVTRSVWEAFFHDPRYRPSFTQRRLVEAGYLGRKTGRGYYDYGTTERPEPARDEALGRQILERVLAMLVNEAADAVYLGVATPADVELAMTKGVNYPKGLLAWGDEYGLDRVLARMEALREEYQEDRYRASPLLRRTVRAGGRLAP